MHSQRLEHTKKLALAVSACLEHAEKSFLLSSRCFGQASGIFLAGSQHQEQASASFLPRSKGAGQAKKSFLMLSKCIERATKVIFNELKTLFHDSILFQPSSIDGFLTSSLPSYFGIDRFLTSFGMTGALIIWESGGVKTACRFYSPALFSSINCVIPNEVRNLSIPGYRNTNEMRDLKLNYQRGQIKRENSIENVKPIPSIFHLINTNHLKIKNHEHYCKTITRIS